jgi:hypothetical protein
VIVGVATTPTVVPESGVSKGPSKSPPDEVEFPLGLELAPVEVDAEVGAAEVVVNGSVPEPVERLPGEAAVVAGLILERVAGEASVADALTEMGPAPAPAVAWVWNG